MSDQIPGLLHELQRHVTQGRTDVVEQIKTRLRLLGHTFEKDKAKETVAAEPAPETAAQ